MSSFIAIHRDDHGDARELRAIEEVVASVHGGAGLTWLHLRDLTRDDIPLLEDQLGLHPLAVEDCLNDDYQRPKVDDYEDYLFVLVHGIDYGRTDESVRTAELNLFVGRTWVISSSLVDMPALDAIADQVRATPTALPASADLLAYTLIDALVDGILPVVDRMTEVTDLIEDEALANPNPALLEHLIRLKRSVMRMNRVIGPQRDLLAQVSRGAYPLLGNDSAIFFRDVYDHLLRLDDMTVNLRDRADHAVTTYHSALSIKQNETMRILAIVASIFLPLTLLAGIYGMNFANMPELDSQYGYFIVLGVIVVVVAGGTYAIFGRALMGWSRDRIGNLASFALEPPVITETIREASRLRSRVLQQASKITRR